MNELTHRASGKTDAAAQAQANKNAMLAIQWIMFLAQVEHNGKIKIGGQRLPIGEIIDILHGKITVEGLKESIDLLVNDPNTYFNKKMAEGFEKQEPIKQDAVAMRDLPSLAFNNNINDIMHYELAMKGDHASEDSWSMSSWALDNKMAEIEEAMERGEEITPDPPTPIKAAARNLVWVTEARKNYKEGKFFIKTAEGNLKPAWEPEHIELDGKVLKDGITDYKPLSVDQKFYNDKGDDFYTFFNFIHGMGAMGMVDSEPFCQGTPTFDDITDQALITSVNTYIKALSKDAPIVALGLAADASPLLKGIEAPETDFSIKRKFWEQNDMSSSVKYSSDETLQKKIDAAGKNDEMNAFEKSVQDFIAASKDKINQSNAQNTNGLVAAPLLGQ